MCVCVDPDGSPLTRSDVVDEHAMLIGDAGSAEAEAEMRVSLGDTTREWHLEDETTPREDYGGSGARGPSPGPRTGDLTALPSSQ